MQKVISYHAGSSSKSNSVMLNSNHAYFLLVDNGTDGKFGSDIALRKKLEKFISQQKIITSKWRKSPVFFIFLILNCFPYTLNDVCYFLDTIRKWC